MTYEKKHVGIPFQDAFNRIVYVLLTSCSAILCDAQQNGSNITEKPGKLLQLVVNAVKKGKVDSSALSENNEHYFLPYEGKVIRKISIRQFGFDQNFNDSSKRENNFGTRLLGKMHRTTRGWVIRDNLFIKENTRLNAYNLADNERYLRSLEFIQDARIYIYKVAEDSVDVEVVTKDMFSISIQVKDGRPGNFNAEISDVNVLGMGQTLGLNALVQKNGQPSFGYGVLYNKTNIAHSYMNASVIYSTINPDITNGKQDEHALYLHLQLPLVSQHSRYAGGFTLGRYQSYNIYQLPDSSFYHYGYNYFDSWVGWNIGSRELLRGSSVKDRKVIALRYFNNEFFQRPSQVKELYNFKYDSREGLLAQVTFFRKEFYKANYIYGFGATEDVPDGYNLCFTGGLYRQLDLKRIYAGVEANRYIASDRGDFLQYFLKAGAFINKGEFQDKMLLVGASAFSRLMVKGNAKLRQYISLSYSKLVNRVGLSQFDLNNNFGLRYFSGDSLFGTQRISLHTETFLFLKYKLLNYRFAPFAFADASLYTPEHLPFYKSDAYYGIGCGLRIRNENLVFGTIEFRFAYFPRTPDDMEHFKMTLTTNIGFRRTISYISEPEIIRLNSDPQNEIY